jgi:hypothetical protein
VSTADEPVAALESAEEALADAAATGTDATADALTPVADAAESTAAAAGELVTEATEPVTDALAGPAEGVSDTVDAAAEALAATSQNVEESVQAVATAATSGTDATADALTPVAQAGEQIVESGKETLVDAAAAATETAAATPVAEAGSELADNTLVVAEDAVEAAAETGLALSETLTAPAGTVSDSLTPTSEAIAGSANTPQGGVQAISDAVATTSDVLVPIAEASPQLLDSEGRTVADAAATVSEQLPLATHAGEQLVDEAVAAAAEPVEPPPEPISPLEEVLPEQAPSNEPVVQAEPDTTAPRAEAPVETLGPTNQVEAEGADTAVAAGGETTTVESPAQTLTDPPVGPESPLGTTAVGPAGDPTETTSSVAAEVHAAFDLLGTGPLTAAEFPLPEVGTDAAIAVPEGVLDTLQPPDAIIDASAIIDLLSGSGSRVALAGLVCLVGQSCASGLTMSELVRPVLEPCRTNLRLTFQALKFESCETGAPLSASGVLTGSVAHTSRVGRKSPPGARWAGGMSPKIWPSESGGNVLVRLVAGILAAISALIVGAQGARRERRTRERLQYRRRMHA